MTAWFLTLAFMAFSFGAATEALWRWRTAETRRDVAAVVLHAVAAVALFDHAWTVGAR